MKFRKAAACFAAALMVCGAAVLPAENGMALPTSLSVQAATNALTSSGDRCTILVSAANLSMLIPICSIAARSAGPSG